MNQAMLTWNLLDSGFLGRQVVGVGWVLCRPLVKGWIGRRFYRASVHDQV